MASYKWGGIRLPGNRNAGAQKEGENMNTEKIIATHLTKCYALAEIQRDGQTQYLAASEKNYPCIVLDAQGKVIETVWTGPGGVMTLEPLPGGNGAFLATHRFYSPNDSAEASIVLAQPGKDGWQVRTLCKLPFVHRFGILERDGRRYLLAATLKSAHAFKDDWTCPGRVWVGELPENLDEITEEQPLRLTALVSGLYRNHGFFKFRKDGYDAALIGTDNGIFEITPPVAGGQWQYDCILETPASDMLLADFDHDGEQELLVLAPFHGEQLTVYKKLDGAWKPVHQFPQPLPFLHALGVGTLGGREVAVIGHRKDDRDLLLVSCEAGQYELHTIDHDVGPANVLCRSKEDHLWILAANREIDEVAIYKVYE